MKENHVKLKIEDFSKGTLKVRKGLWNEVVRLREEEGKFAVIN